MMGGLVFSEPAWLRTSSRGSSGYQFITKPLLCKRKTARTVVSFDASSGYGLIVSPAENDDIRFSRRKCSHADDDWSAPLSRGKMTYEVRNGFRSTIGDGARVCADMQGKRFTKFDRGTTFSNLLETRASSTSISSLRSKARLTPAWSVCAVRHFNKTAQDTAFTARFDQTRSLSTGRRDRGRWWSR